MNLAIQNALSRLTLEKKLLHFIYINYSTKHVVDIGLIYMVVIE